MWTPGPCCSGRACGIPQQAAALQASVAARSRPWRCWNAGVPRQQQQQLVPRDRQSCWVCTRAPLRRTAAPLRAALDPEQLTSREVPLEVLQAQLDAAIDGEEYEAAAQLRDEIQRRRLDSRLAVEEANQRFYAAFTSGSLAAMSEIWGKGEHVQCVHPGLGCIAGREAVMDSWRLVLGSGRMKISLEDVRIYAGEDNGFVTCLEVVDSGDGKGRVMATNVFEKQRGRWKIVHHHASPAPRMI